MGSFDMSDFDAFDEAVKDAGVVGSKKCHRDKQPCIQDDCVMWTGDDCEEVVAASRISAIGGLIEEHAEAIPAFIATMGEGLAKLRGLPVVIRQEESEKIEV